MHFRKYVCDNKYFLKSLSIKQAFMHLFSIFLCRIEFNCGMFLVKLIKWLEISNNLQNCYCAQVAIALKVEK